MANIFPGIGGPTSGKSGKRKGRSFEKDEIPIILSFELTEILQENAYTKSEKAESALKAVKTIISEWVRTWPIGVICYILSWKDAKLTS